MRCLYCHQPLGVFRRLIDRQYCSEQHRARMAERRSARALRNAEEREDLSEVWPVYLRSLEEAQDRKQPQSNLVSNTTFAIFIVMALLVGSMGLSSHGSSSVIASSGPLEELRSYVRGHSAIRLSDNFQSGVNDWKPVTNDSSGWSFKYGYVQPGRLRLWSNSLNLRDYQLEFVSQIDKKGVGWAFRAQDAQNYYGSKIAISHPGPLPSADFQRFAVVNGLTKSRITLPLPLVLRSDSLYRIQVNVKGDWFTTSVNGQVVDTFSDGRLQVGGVGFFTDRGESATVRWVTVSDRDTLMGRMLSFLGLIQPIQPSVYYAVLPSL